MMNVTIDFDSGRRKAILTSDSLSDAREHFSVEDKSQAFKRGFRNFKFKTRIYAITPQGRFEPRLVGEVLRYLKGKYFELDVTFTEAFKSVIKLPSLDKDIVFQLPVTSVKPLRDYQYECVSLSLQKGSGVIVLPTSAGKTLVMATLVASIQQQLAENFKTLILVPDTGLVAQSYNDFLEYGVDELKLTKWTGNDTPNPKASIIIANSQILLSEKQDVSLLNEIQLLIIDEVHKLKQSNKISKLVAKIPAKLRYGLTGTLPEENLDRWHIIGQLGDVIYQKKSIDLRQQKYITNVQVVVLKMQYLNPPHIEASDSSNPTQAYEQEQEYLQNNNFRNVTIRSIVTSLNKNALILVDRIAHGEILLSVLNEIEGKEIHFICGEVEIQERERVRALMEVQDNIICVAISKIFSTGVNIRNLHYIFFASIGKAKTKIVQSIGRSLRLHESKKQAVIFDIGDDMRYGNKHLQERINLYTTESIPYTIKHIKQSNE